MKIFKNIPTLLILVIFLFSCALAKGNVKRFKDHSILIIDDYGFELTLPIGWNIKDLSVYNEPTKDKKRAHIIEAVDNNGTRVDIYVRKIPRMKTKAEWIAKRLNRHLRKLAVGKEKQYVYKTASGEKADVRCFLGKEGKNIAFAFFTHDGNYIYAVIQGDASINKTIKEVIIPGFRFIS